MSKGRRYDGEQKLNLKKVFAVVAVIVIFVLAIVGIRKILKSDKNTITSKNIELHYFTLFKNGNWGVINSSGETIIEPANGEMIEIPDKSKAVFICTYDVSTVDESYKTKAINDKNQEIFTGYDNIFTVQNYDDENNLWYESNVLKVQKDNKYGLINLDGKEILPCEYDSITAMKGVRNSIIVKNDANTGIVNTNGTVVVPVQYSSVEVIGKNAENGYIVKNSENKFGVIKSDGNLALDCKYEAVENMVDGNRYLVKENGIWKLISVDGTSYLDGKVDNVISMNNGDVVIKQNGKCGVLNIETDLKIPFEYDELTYLFDNKYSAKKDGKYGVINTNNETVVDYKYDEIIYNKGNEYVKGKVSENTYEYMTKDLSVKFTAGNETKINGFISVTNGNDVKYYNNKLEEKSNKDVYTSNTLFIIKENGKYGFVDKDGKVVVEAKYDDAREQNDYGFVAVKKDGKWGSLDQYGNVVIEPTYTIKNENNVDFVGRWHVCADKNANYYTDLDDVE